MANVLKIKRSSTTETIPSVAFGELVMTDVSSVLKFYGTDSSNAATLLIQEPSGNGSEFWCGDGTWKTPSGSGDVVGPASATDNAVARFDATTGKLIQNSVVTIADTTGDMAGVGTLNTHTIQGGTGTLALTSDIPSVANMVETTDTDVTGWGFIDNGTVATGASTKLPTQAAVKAYVDAVAASEMTYQGAYDATTDPNSSASVGDMYTVTVGGTGATSYWSTALEVGDMIIAETNNPASQADWSVVQSGNQSYALSTRNINTAANSGLAGGGDLTADRSLSIDASNLTADTTLDGASDYVVAQTAAGTRKVIVNNYLDMGTF